MRYYSVNYKGDSEDFRPAVKELMGFMSTCQPALQGMNEYIVKNIKNYMTFFFYREEENVMYAVYSFDEQKIMPENVGDLLDEVLRAPFKIRRKATTPCEITMCQFMDCFIEAMRRDYLCRQSQIRDIAHLWYYDCYNMHSEEAMLSYKYAERMIENDADKSARYMYDPGFAAELKNIEEHPNQSDLSVNMVHYIISARSMDAASTMVGSLAGSLRKANRLKSSRIEMISEIDPGVFHRTNSYIEQIIEYNQGGIIVFDLSEKFGCNAEDYVMAAQYLEKLVKKYKNKCLFVFTYDMEQTGFSYLLLPELNHYMIPVTLREGTGDRRSAVNYLKALIKKSEYAAYTDQANEFFKKFPGKRFTQTDVLKAYEQFAVWCFNKNIRTAYENDPHKDFLLDRDENVESAYEKLQKMIGLTDVKKQIDSIIATDIVEKERKSRKGNDYRTNTMHMIFGGNPGTAKTTVARYFAGIAKEKGILKSGAFVECGGMDLDGLGCVERIRDAFVAAKGGVLFIDEAYAMKSAMAVTVLLQEMERQREEVIVILAGYNERMRDFVELNEGLKSRIPHWITFPDYSTDELTDIFKQMIAERGFRATKEAVRAAHYIFEKVRRMDNFGNGRFVRNLMEQGIQNQSVRLLALRSDVKEIKKNELFVISGEDMKSPDEKTKEVRMPGSARQEFDQIIGLEAVKGVINKVIAGYKLNKLRMDRGLSGNKASLHMVFAGNPGTAKTTVARLFAEILKDEKVLPSGNFVEAGRADLVGEHVGSTAPLVKKKFKEAQGGVLFIDEAYSLCDDCENSFGDEAINTIVQEMENHREDVIVIFAGYPKPMKQFLDRNSGMLSRIAFQVEFEDYTVEELCEITKLMVSRKKMVITDAALEKLRRNYEQVSGSEDYGNGRYVRKLLEEAEMNLAARIVGRSEKEITNELLTTIEEVDIPETNHKKNISLIAPIGFAC